MATAGDIVRGALRLIGAIAPGETPEGAEMSDALASLNQLVDSLSSDGLSIYEITREEFTLTAGQQSYSIGSGGDLDTTRPQVIEKAAIKESGQSDEHPVDIISLDEWAQITVKNTQSTLPMRLYSEGGYPLLNFRLWPVPSVANTLVLYTLKPLSTFAASSTDMSMPPGSERMLKYNLAVDLAPEYSRSASPEVVAVAAETKESFKRQNIRPVIMQSDALGLGTQRTFNYLTGE